MRLFRDVGPRISNWEEMARLLGFVMGAEGVGGPNLRFLIQCSGLRDNWNRTLARDRASYLGDWITPFVRKELLDLFAGDLSVTAEIGARHTAPSGAQSGRRSASLSISRRRSLCR